MNKPPAFTLLAFVTLLLGVAAIWWRTARQSPPEEKAPSLDARPTVVRREKKAQTPEAHLSELRKRFMPADRLVAEMNPSKGGVMLDIGAGFGLNTLAMASATGPDGIVFATDVDGVAMDFLAREAAARGFKNVVPVQVRAGGFDEPFYRRQFYDVTLMCDILPMIRQIGTFMSSLKPCMRPGTGRLWVVDLRCDADYTLIEVGDLELLARRILHDARSEPIKRRMDGETLTALGSLEDGHASAPVSERTLAFLNQLLDDQSLWVETSVQVTLNPAFKGRREFLLGKLCEFTAFDLPETSAATQRTASRALNRLIISELLGLNDWLKAFALDVTTQADFERLMDWWLYRRHDFLPMMAETGYTLRAEHPIFPFHTVWEFCVGAAPPGSGRSNSAEVN